MELIIRQAFKNTPIESLEQHIDIHVHRYELLPNTGGAGEHRGDMRLAWNLK